MSTQENIELTRRYITEALFALMEQTPYEKISISDITKKAGVGRATFYRHFKTKDEIVREYFESKTAAFLKSAPNTPTCADDYYEMIFTSFAQLKQQKKAFQRLMDAHMEGYYLDYMNRKLVLNFSKVESDAFSYVPYHVAGSICNVSLEWIRRDCAESVKQITDTYFHLLLPQLPFTQQNPLPAEASEL